jgi:hypothetical protein
MCGAGLEALGTRGYSRGRSCTYLEATDMADDVNIKGHVATYSSMIAMLKWGGLAVFIIAALVVWLIS